MISTRLVKRNDTSFFRTVQEMLRAKLFVSGWMFENMLDQYSDYIEALSIVYDEGNPVALGMVWNYPEEYEISGEQIGCFVRPAFRRRGLGSIAIELLGGTEGREWRVGELGSGYFWTTCEEELCI